MQTASGAFFYILRRTGLICLYWSLIIPAYSQTHRYESLPNVELIDSRQQYLHSQKIVLDSLTGYYQGKSLAEMLSENMGAVNYYGFSSLSVPTLRGTGSQHTLIVWHGYPINPPSSGITDLNLVSAGFFDQTLLTTGGSPLYGSQAIGAIIHLQSNTQWDQTRTTISTDLSSYNATNLFASHQQTLGKVFHYKTQIHYQDAQNEYEYINITKPEKPREKAEFSATQGAALNKV